HILNQFRSIGDLPGYCRRKAGMLHKVKRPGIGLAYDSIFDRLQATSSIRRFSIAIKTRLRVFDNGISVDRFKVRKELITSTNYIEGAAIGIGKRKSLVNKRCWHLVIV